MATIFDVAVIGAGIEGSCTAYQLARDGNTTLLLEQFFLPHSRGSSHGSSRIIRKFYDDDVYTKMMSEAYRQWSRIENMTGQELYKQTAMLVVGFFNDPKQGESIRKSMVQNNAKHIVLTKEQVRSEYPMFRFKEDADLFLLDQEAGILKADKCLLAVQNLFKRFGGVLHDGEKVLQIVPGDVVDIHTNKNLYRAKKVVITAGPWTTKLLKPLRVSLHIKPVRVTVCYFKEKIPGTYDLSCAPITLHNDYRENSSFYTLPPYEYPHHMKVAFHGGPEIDPDDRDKTQNKEYLERICEYVKDHFPGLEQMPSIIETCIYTVKSADCLLFSYQMTPDEGFVLDYHPQHRNIVIGAGFSGHGFKLAPVVGKLLKQLVTERTYSTESTASAG
ncbi:peroxisomal sarcosine oxidase-like isoform X2 [Tubulanus polymorphus]|uniref:peroxisomal sarcosine oxidase-like isoform X2 n=1 Tax=Tubulanus polymorphus TaxID=672921 RepID=UPI003DA615B4